MLCAGMQPDPVVGCWCVLLWQDCAAGPPPPVPKEVLVSHGPGDNAVSAAPFGMQINQQLLRECWGQRGSTAPRRLSEGACCAPGQRSEGPSAAAHQQPPSPPPSQSPGSRVQEGAGMPPTVGVGVNDIHELCVRGVQPLARRRAPVQEARGVQACSTKPWPWHHLAALPWGRRTAGGGLTRDSSQCAIKHLSHKAGDVRSQAHSYHVHGVKGRSVNLRCKSTRGHVFLESSKKLGGGMEHLSVFHSV